MADQKPSNDSTQYHPRGVIIARYVARLAILLMALFIFMWWPVDSFDPKGFDAWSTRMENLPEEVWYVLLSVILSWGTTEVMAARALKNASSKINSAFSNDEEDDFLNPPTEFDGRFANINEDYDFLNSPPEPNPVIDEWKNNEVG